MVSCTRVQQLTVNWISGKPQIDNGKSVFKIYCSHSRNPDRGLIDTRGQIKQEDSHGL
ncbi:rCG37112 [Rattus norvegicus]|uniref:RCG37112 n=1 Tax=Rattus norvegicus TaxID=10116 RepID=A6HUI9_RAT|nr:rCG37112 [Rattus norvegicus]